MDELYFKDKTLAPGEGHAWGKHDHAVVTLVLRGRLDESFAGEKHSCLPGELHYKPAGAVHATATGPNGVRMFLVGVGGETLAAIEGESATAPRALGRGARTARALTAFLAIAERRHSDLGWWDPVRGLWRLAGPGHVAEATPNPAWVGEVRQRIRSTGCERRGLTALAREFGVHPVYLARVFRRSYGESIGSARRGERIDLAVERLITGGQSLAEIALDLGYSDQSHFTRDFKKATGWPPGRFRRVIRAFSKGTERGRGEVSFVQDP